MFHSVAPSNVREYINFFFNYVFLFVLKECSSLLPLFRSNPDTEYLIFPIYFLLLYFGVQLQLARHWEFVLNSHEPPKQNNILEFALKETTNKSMSAKAYINGNHWETDFQKQMAFIFDRSA